MGLQAGNAYHLSGQIVSTRGIAEAVQKALGIDKPVGSITIEQATEVCGCCGCRGLHQGYLAHDSSICAAKQSSELMCACRSTAPSFNGSTLCPIKARYLLRCSSLLQAHLMRFHVQLMRAKRVSSLAGTPSMWMTFLMALLLPAQQGPGANFWTSVVLSRSAFTVC